MRILLVEDHPLMRSGLAQLLARHFPSAVINEAGDAATAMSRIAGSPWDIIILDIDLPDRSGLEFLADARALHPNGRVLVLSGQNEQEFGPRALRAGAYGFVHKSTSSAEIVTAVERVLSGRRYISQELASVLADTLENGAGEPHRSLSAREFEVLRLIGAGNTATEIGKRLGLSVKSVSTYRARILQKLHLRTTGELVRYALEHKLV